MKNFKLLALLWISPLITNCTVQTQFVANFVSPDSSTLVGAKTFLQKTENLVSARSCFTKAGFPFQWELKTDTVLKKALLKNPSAVGLIDAEFTSEIFVLGVFNRVCLEVKGQPAYLEGS